MTSKSAPTPHKLTTWELMKMAAPIVLFGILLPTVDNVTDLIMITRLYTGITGCVLIRNDLPWQERYICEEDPDTYCDNKNCVGDNLYLRGCEWIGCSKFKLKGSPEGIHGCKENWQNEWVCQEDPVTYCESNPYSDECGSFKRGGSVLWIPGCENCWFTANFCEKRPDHPTCAYFKHTTFATMFVGNKLTI